MKSAEWMGAPGTGRRVGLHLLQAVLGLGLCLLIAFSRLPSLYDGLWEDEIHYNAPTLSAGSLRELRDSTDWLMRPLLDFALRRFVWFSPLGLAVTERNLALVSWLIAAANLLFVVFVPWSRYWLLRLIAGFMLGACTLEAAYSTEAQSYSFISLASMLLFLGFYATLRQVARKARASQLLYVAAGFAVCINAHFFSWPIAFLVLGLASVYLLWAVPADATRKKLLIGLLVLAVAAVACTIWLSFPALWFMWATPPRPKPTFVLDATTALRFVSHAWEWLNLPGWLYLTISLAGLFHPSREKRYLSSAALLTVLAVKVCLTAFILAKSSYPISDRYFIMFVTPSVLALAVGLESIALRADRRRPGLATAVLSLGAVVFVGFNSERSGAWLAQARAGIEQFRTTPSNYSSRFRFFEQAKSYGRPLLVLTNHCFATDCPRFYMRHLGRPEARVVILNMWPGCETRDTVRVSAIEKFFAEHREDGLVVVFYEIDRGSGSPCPRFADHLLYRENGSLCLAIIEAKHLAAADVLKM